jgi:hypothetical protein
VQDVEEAAAITTASGSEITAAVRFVFERFFIKYYGLARDFKDTGL